MEAVFSQEPEANKWRSATFESIMAAVLKEGSSSSSSLLSLYNANLRDAQNRISTLLWDVTGSPPSNEATETVKRLTTRASELGLQFGVQPSHLNLSQPGRQQQVEIGKEVHDCIDGDTYRGKHVTVDVLVSPGLFRLGDGKGNMMAKVLLTPCDIWPMD